MNYAIYELAVYKELIKDIKKMCEKHVDHNHTYQPILDLIHEVEE